MAKTAEPKEKSCRNTSTGEECRHCAPHACKIKIADWSYEVATDLFVCHNPRSDHYTHTFTEDHLMCKEWD